MKFKLGDSVQKISGSQWKGVIVGTYSTDLTPEGYAVESSTEKGSVQIYPAKALKPLENTRAWTQDHWTEYERKIAAAEREACAQVADEWNDAYALLIAEAIRARGNT